MTSTWPRPRRGASSSASLTGRTKNLVPSLLARSFSTICLRTRCRSDVSDLRVGLCFQPTFNDSDDEDKWNESCGVYTKYQWKGDVFRFGDAGMKDEDLVEEIQAP